jgi:hypothetical protein
MIQDLGGRGVNWEKSNSSWKEVAHGDEAIRVVEIYDHK